MKLDKKENIIIKKYLRLDTSKDKGKNYYFEFVINQEKYIITFENKDNIFI